MRSAKSKDGTTIAFDTYGSGPALILVGGAFQYRAFDPPTAQLAQLLGEHFTVYHYDRRGRGDSTDTKPYAVAREIEDIDALIVDAGGEAMVYGMSSGAALALAAAAHGSAITRLALYEPPFRDEANLPAADFLEHISALDAAGDRDGTVSYFLTAGIGMPEAMLDDMRQSPMWSGFTAIAPTLVYDSTIMGDSRVPTEVLKRVTVPTLVIAGGNSPAWAQDSVAAVGAALSQGTVQAIAGQDHQIDPAKLVPVLVDFLKKM